MPTGSFDAGGNPVKLIDSLCSVRSALPFTLVSSSPSNGAQDVALSSSIFLTFSAPVNEETIGIALQVLSSNGSTVPGTVLVLNEQSVQITPTQPLLTGTGYGVDMRGVTDSCRNRLSGSTEIHFITAGPQPLPAISVAPQLFDFGAVSLASTVQKDFVIQNTGSSILTITGVNISTQGDFSPVFPAPPFNIAPNGYNTFTVFFKPIALGLRQGTVNLYSNASATPTTVPVFGTGGLHYYGRPVYSLYGT